MELDHIFICSPSPEAQIQALIALGVEEASGRAHLGQGTCNRRIFFDNAMLEWLWMADEKEICSPRTAPTGLYQRCNRNSIQQQAQVSPFGVCFRPSYSGEKVCFPSWAYHPLYLPDHLQIDIATSPLSEPMWFYLSFTSRQAYTKAFHQQPNQHNPDFMTITRVQVTLPEANHSDAAKMFSEQGLIQLQHGPEHRLDIEFNNGKAGRSQPLPAQPAVHVCW